MSLPTRTPEYQDLELIQSPGMLAFGPIGSRRFGVTIGVNVLGDKKICSFDCPYCELGRTELRMNQLKEAGIFPSVADIDAALRACVRAAIAEQKDVDTIVISGNGEPTLHPEFPEAIQAVIRARNEVLSETKIVVLTNGAHLDQRKIIVALNEADERIVKLDAGNDGAFAKINEPVVRATLAKISTNARKLKDVTLQAMFVQGAIDNTGNQDIDDWLEIVGIIRPKVIQIFTLARVPAVPGLKRPEEDTLYAIASKVKRKLQIECQVFF